MNNLPTDEENMLAVDNSHWTNQREALERLNDKDFFNTLVKDGYFKEYSWYLIKSMLDPVKDPVGHRGMVMGKLIGVAKLQQYFDTVLGSTVTEEQYTEELGERLVKEYNRLQKIMLAMDAAIADEDYKLLIKDSYMGSFLVDQTSLLSNDVIIARGARTEVMETLAGISTFMNYLVDVRKVFIDMSKELNSNEEQEEGVE